MTCLADSANCFFSDLFLVMPFFGTVMRTGDPSAKTIQLKKTMNFLTTCEAMPYMIIGIIKESNESDM